MVFQIGKHYILCFISSRKTKQSLKKKKRKKLSSPYTSRRLHLDQTSRNMPPVDYSVYRLPEPEISISSAPEIIKPIAKTLILKETPEQQDASILSSYIDDFFTATQSIKVKTYRQSEELECDMNLPLDDEIITVTEPRNYRTSPPANDENFTKIEQNSVTV